MSLTIYLNGRYVRVTPVEFERLLPGEIEGQGAFETMRLYDGWIFAFAEHMERLSRGLRHFKLSLPVSRGKILDVVSRLSRLNKLRNARVRVIIWKDKKRKNISMSLQPLSLPSKAKYQRGFHILTCGARPKSTRHSHVKSIDYKMLRSIAKDAHRDGFDEAIYSYLGEVIEGTRTNVFYVSQNVLHTPAIHCGALNGITRQKVIACARRLKIPVRIGRVKLSELIDADEAFLTGSTLEIMPIDRIDRRWRIGRGPKERPVVHQLQRAYKEMVKREVSDCPPKKRLV